MDKSGRQECPIRVSHKSVLQGSHKKVLWKCPTIVARKKSRQECPISPQECPARVSCKNGLQKSRVSHKNVQQECQCPTRVPHKSVLQKCPIRVSDKNILREYPIRMTYKSYKSVPHECPPRVSHKSLLQMCPIRVSYKSILRECP